jgi:hypothetical protein
MFMMLPLLIESIHLGVRRSRAGITEGEPKNIGYWRAASSRKIYYHFGSDLSN